MEDNKKPPKKEIGDNLHAAAKAIAGVVPAGSLLAELIEQFIVPPYQKRQAEWMESVSDRLGQLERSDSSFKMEDLKNNPDFLDVMIATTKSAIATKSVVKKEALLNALENIALRKTEGDITDSIFLRYIDELGEADIQILGVLERPFDRRSEPTGTGIYQTYEELILSRFNNLSSEVLRIMINNLFNKRLLARAGDRINERPEIFHEDRTLLTLLGMNFLKFIRRTSS